LFLRPNPSRSSIHFSTISERTSKNEHSWAPLSLKPGRTRLGVGVSNSREEYAVMGVYFGTQGSRCDEQMSALKKLWMENAVAFSGEFHTLDKQGINPLPVQLPIPM
jgi:alkanesulfonate monooxygenase SsuD/methylene tetrahydromethanopterin reductase-like flavin-dependent oxidoreductase (luciferase family)